MDGQQREVWKFPSYRARFAPDPIEKHLIVAFTDGRVSDVYEEWHDRKDRSTSTSDDPIRKRERLKGLRDRGVITEEEFDAKKSELLDEI